MAKIKRFDNGEILHELEGAGMAMTVLDAAAKGIVLFKADLRGVKFTDRDLTGVNFSYARMNCCDFSGSLISGCDFTETDLSGADFSNSAIENSKMVSARTIFAKLPSKTLHVIGGFGFPVFISPECTCIGDFGVKTAEEWLTVTEEDALEIGGQRLVDDLHCIKRLIECSLAL